MSPTPPQRHGHPRGLYVLFFTELWERYSFYSMMAILTLYMDEVLHFDSARIGRVYGGYIGGVYLMPLVGGLLADRVLGFYRAVVIGGTIMMIGHLVLAVDSLPFFYAGLVLLATGTGLLKPNVSTIVGNLYRDRPGLRDAGFNLFYMGINLGGLMSPIGVAWLRAHYGWSVAFGSAAGAMLLSLICFVAGRRFVGQAADLVRADAGEVGAVSPDSLLAVSDGFDFVQPLAKTMSVPTSNPLSQSLVVEMRGMKSSLLGTNPFLIPRAIVAASGLRGHAAVRAARIGRRHRSGSARTSGGRGLLSRSFHPEPLLFQGS